MKPRWLATSRFWLGLWLVLFNCALIWGQTYPAQGYVIGGVGLAAAVFVFLGKE